MTSPSPSPSPAVLREHTPVLSLLSRAVVLVSAVVWGVFFFGVIDLLVVPLQDERFHEFFLLETGWGALFTFLVAVPLVAFAVNPRGYVFAAQVAVVAAAVLLPALLVPAPRQVAPAVLLAMTAAVAWFGTGYRSAPLRGLSLRRANSWLVALVAVAAVAASVYAGHATLLARSGEPDEDTWGLMHLPMQASFALALAATAVVSVLAQTGNAFRWRASTIPPAVAAAWFGVVSFAYPDLVGSTGRAGGIACVVWGVLLVVVAFAFSDQKVVAGEATA